jgi:hypothetical protein
MGGSTPESRTRELEVFLDAVAAHASRDSSWLLDERFSELLPEAERQLVRRARELWRALPAENSAWAPLLKALSSLGCIDPERDPRDHLL